MMRHVNYFVCLLVFSASVSIPGTYADTPSVSDNEIDLLTDENFAVDLTNRGFNKEAACNSSYPCLNGGRCLAEDCYCPSEYVGARCEQPAWCTWGKCGFGSDVRCVWDRDRKRGECRCLEPNHTYLPKERKCLECDCGGHGTCQAVDDVLVCKCHDKYALKSSATNCEACDCGPQSERCSFSSSGEKVCQCKKGYASKISHWISYGPRCEECDCGEHGKCSWDGDEKLCDCEAGYRVFRGECVDCNCGKNGMCNLDAYGDKVCSCDYGSAEKDGICEECDCNYLSTSRTLGANCSFVDGVKECECPPGYRVGADFCEDIDECTTSISSPCPANSRCTNKPGTYECKCDTGYHKVKANWAWDPTTFACEDINECLDYPCTSHLTSCVNSPGSFDCVCRDGYYPTSGTSGSSYKPAYNNCYETQTQWRAATIAIGVIFAVAIMGLSCYIMKHKKSS